MNESATMAWHWSQYGMQDFGLAGALALLGVIVLVAVPVRVRQSRIARIPEGQDGTLSRGLIDTASAVVLAPVRLVHRHAKRRSITARINAALRQLGVEAQGAFRPRRHVDPDPDTPDLDSRIDALLALEQIAQDSVRFDTGQDHVRILKIICSYIRDAAPASSAIAFPLPDWAPLHASATETEKAQHLMWRDVRFANRVNSNARDWAAARTGPRADVALALRILGRRDPDQRAVEAAWGNRNGRVAVWPFDTPCPGLPEPTGEAPYSAAQIDSLRSDLRDWTARLEAYRGYRPDLRNTNLQGADLSGLVLSGWRMEGARLEGANLCESRLVGTSLNRARLVGADLCNARLEGANLSQARMEAAILRGARLQGATLIHARMEWANLKDARLEAADLQDAKMEVASLFKARLAGAVLRNAHLDGAVLRRARLEKADLSGAHMGWVDLKDARLEGALLNGTGLPHADLGGARLQGAELYQTRLDGADLRQTRLDHVALHGVKMTRVTSLHCAVFRHTLFKEIDLTGVQIEQMQVDQSYGDASVVLPQGVIAPRHWPDWDLPVFGDTGVRGHWRKWREDPDQYAPPQVPD